MLSHRALAASLVQWASWIWGTDHILGFIFFQEEENDIQKSKNQGGFFSILIRRNNIWEEMSNEQGVLLKVVCSEEGQGGFWIHSVIFVAVREFDVGFLKTSSAAWIGRPRQRPCLVLGWETTKDIWVARQKKAMENHLSSSLALKIPWGSCSLTSVIHSCPDPGGLGYAELGSWAGLAPFNPWKSIVARQRQASDKPPLHISRFENHMRDYHEPVSIIW